MRAISNNKVVGENLNVFKQHIDGFVGKLRANPTKNRQKILEVCHVGKFLTILGYGSIERLSEHPDFIINIDGQSIGLEHHVVLNSSYKEKEGYFQNIFSIAETLIQSDDEIPNFHSNCWLKDDLTFRLNEKSEKIDEIVMVVKHFIVHGTLLPNSVIAEMDRQPHDRKSISPNFGSWWQAQITSEILMSAISKKEQKIPNYIVHSSLHQWLLLVIGGLDNSSYEVMTDIDFEIVSRFDKIFLLEDFRGRLFQLK
ncbi:MAG TPA: hypothetical protein VG737_17640 [Cyclobacteriaceae bacterium]|nr:hypothetical protein [Cyclobacteriaceae bacterium]